MFINKGIHKIKALLKNGEFKFLNRIAKGQGYSLVQHKPVPGAEIVIDNFFKTAHQKNALVSYIIYPFLGEIENNHSNNRECYSIAEILNELGYNVDIINWNDASFLSVKKYELVIDNHNNLERLLPYFTEKTFKIFHATNAHWLYQNQVEYNRCYEFFLNTGLAIPPSRLITAGNSAQYADAISMFGNEFTKSTYGEYGNKVHHLPMSVTTVPEILSERDLARATNNFLWLNSHGALLKGLDIAIDAFKMLPHLRLYICMDMEKDAAFLNYMRAALPEQSNINFMGWVDTDGADFKELATNCAWVIGTSFSEGGGGSTLNCMAKGMIPVVSRSSSLTLPDNTGFYLEQNDAATLAGLISELVVLPAAQLKERSDNAYHFVTSNHTIDNFKDKYKAFLTAVLPC